MIELKEHNVVPYQNLCCMLEETGRCAYVSATGTGKSYVIGKYIEEHDLLKYTLILTPSNVIQRSWTDLLPGVRTATYQGVTLNPVDLNDVRLLVCDEMHHLGATEWGRVYQSMIESFEGLIIGLSATPIRYLDNARDMVEELFEGHQVVGLELPKAINDGILPGFDYITALYNLPQVIPKRSVSNTYTDRLFRQLDIFASKYSFQKILRENLSDENYKVAVFVNSIEMIAEIRTICEESFPNAGHYDAHSKMSKSDRSEAISHFSTDTHLSFLYTVDLLNEGAHLNGVNSIIMFRKTKSPTVYLQQIGRALNHTMANRRIKIFDFVANHTNLKSYTNVQGSTIGWIQRGITNPKRQIVVSDYAMEELEILERLQNILSGRWLPEEDEIMRIHYKTENGVDKIAALLPHRSRAAIISHAKALDLANERAPKNEEFYEDIRQLYTQKNGPELLMEKYPDLTNARITNIANRMGLKRRPTSQKWTAADDEFLLEHPDMSIKELMQTLGRSRSSICGRRFALGIATRQRHRWTEEEDAILRNNPDMTANELRKQYFPDLIASVINTRRVALGISRSTVWSKDKIDCFKQLYQQGGFREVKKHPLFSDMSKDAISGAATRYGVHAPKGQNTVWTDAEEQIILEYLNIPDNIRPPRTSLRDKLPNHTVNSIKGKVNHMRKKLKSNCTL